MSAASVTKSVMERYAIRNGHEWATICVREFTSSVPTGDRDPYFGGEILINSSFGSWANTWGACGRRFKRFLTEIEMDYAFGKFMGGRSQLEVFDGDATIQALKEQLIENRRTNALDKEDARSLWERIENEIDTDSNDAFITSCMRISDDLGSRYPMKEDFAEPWYLTRTKPDPQAVGFWREIWPAFKQELLGELEGAEVAA